jgi:hypothetical protein
MADSCTTLYRSFAVLVLSVDDFATIRKHPQCVWKISNAFQEFVGTKRATSDLSAMSAMPVYKNRHCTHSLVSFDNEDMTLGVR